MRINMPVTSTEVTFSEETKLISATDLTGRITYCNSDFIRVSGYEEDELIGSPHNLVRHPDMPQEAFQNMWTALKSGKPWMGMVKNRCKNGDYYWVHAYVTPIYENEKVVGYESVRQKPTEELKRKAEKIYTQIKAGKKVNKSYAELVTGMVVTASLAAAYGAYCYDPLYSLAVLTGTTVALPLWVHARRESKLASIIKGRLKNSAADALSAWVFSNHTNREALLDVMLLSKDTHKETVLNRVKTFSALLGEHSKVVGQNSEEVKVEMGRQLSVAGDVSQSVESISKFLAELTESIKEASEQAKFSEGIAAEGKEASTQSSRAFESLAKHVEAIGKEIMDLTTKIDGIKDAASAIDQISDQTNLLALNAAIEAARAGEAGRGFSVVADEVRSLSQKTQEATQHIHSVLQNVEAQAHTAASEAKKGIEEASEGLALVKGSESKFENISSNASLITQQTVNIERNAEEQRARIETISQRASELEETSKDSIESVTSTLEMINAIDETVNILNDTVKRFQ